MQEKDKEIEVIQEKAARKAKEKVQILLIE